MPPDERELLRLYLSERDMPCPKCGYNLRNCPGPACPECGSGLALHVHPIVRLPLTYSIGVFGLASGLVLGAVLAFAGVMSGPVPLVLGGAVALASVIALFLWDRLYLRTRLRGGQSVLYLVLGAWIGVAVTGSQLAWMIARHRF